MNTEQPEGLRRRAAAYAALGDPTRLAIVDRLATGDSSASELGHALGVPSNLLAHHVRTLENAGLVTRRRSEGDARRSYLSLNAHEEWLARAGEPGAEKVAARRVLFVCTANTARSHLAAATWRQLSAVPAASAGTHPGDAINPHARDAAARHALELPDVAPRSIEETVREHDLVITVCDRAHEELDGGDWAHWSIPDPVPRATASAYDAVITDLADRVRRVAPHVET